MENLFIIVTRYTIQHIIEFNIPFYSEKCFELRKKIDILNKLQEIDFSEIKHLIFQIGD